MLDAFIIIMGVVLSIAGLTVAVWSFMDTRKRYPKGYTARKDYDPES